MASTISGCTQQLADLKVSDAGCGMGESLSERATESEQGSACYRSATSGDMEQLEELEELGAGCAMGESSAGSVLQCVRESEQGVLPCGDLFVSAQCASIVGGVAKSLGDCGESGIQEDIERSKQHWSLLADFGEEVGEEVVAEVDNVQVFKALQSNPTWGGFFGTFGFDVGGRYGSEGEMVVGDKFAEGGQAELYHAQVKWKSARQKKWDLEHGVEHVVKVFKKGTFLHHLYKQLPYGYLKFKVESWKNKASATSNQFPRYHCEVVRGILLKNGQFAYLLVKEHFDLRSLIERNLRLRSNSEDSGPFCHEDAEWLMYEVAVGVKWLHEHNIVHRDLKASNVLVREGKSGWPKWNCFIADYECSVGVVGTGFFRAPEILQAVKEKIVTKRREVFSMAADVYGYGMICYEILTGKLPFEGYKLNDYDRVLQGPQLVLPGYVDDWTRLLLSRCWQLNPHGRPSMEEIVNSFLDHSTKVREVQVGQSEYWRKLNQQN